jgi:hypothetical protein
LGRSISPSKISLNGTIGTYAGKEIDRVQKRYVVETELNQAEADTQESGGAGHPPRSHRRRSRFCSGHFASAARLTVFLFSLTRPGASLDLGKPFETVGPLLDLIDQRMRALTLTAGTFPGSISVHSGALHWVT